MSSLDKYTGPLYRRIADDVIDQIRKGTLHPGEKLPSERALCALYEVSQITVRRALRELRHGGLVTSRHGLGWYVQDGAPQHAETTEVAVILPDLDWLCARLVRHLAEDLVGSGVYLRLTFTDGDGDAEARALEAARPLGAAAVLAVPAGDEPSLAERYARHTGEGNPPLLLLVREVENSHAPAVFWDEQAAVAMATRHLLDLGHRRLAYVGGDPAAIEGQKRYWGFASSVWDRGLELPLDWVIAGQAGSAALRARLDAALAGSARPTAVVCSDDLLAAEVLARLAQAGLRCPADVAVASVGDRDLCPVLSTPLTSVRPDLRGLARAAATMTRDLLAGREVQSARFGGHLVERQSSGASLPGPR